jgi:hypothetical protein
LPEIQRGRWRWLHAGDGAPTPMSGDPIPEIDAREGRSSLKDHFHIPLLSK